MKKIALKITATLVVGSLLTLTFAPMFGAWNAAIVATLLFSLLIFPLAYLAEVA